MGKSPLTQKITKYFRQELSAEQWLGAWQSSPTCILTTHVRVIQKSIFQKVIYE